MLSPNDRRNASPKGTGSSPGSPSCHCIPATLPCMHGTVPAPDRAWHPGSSREHHWHVGLSDCVSDKTLCFLANLLSSGERLTAAIPQVHVDQHHGDHRLSVGSLYLTTSLFIQQGSPPARDWDEPQPWIPLGDHGCPCGCGERRPSLPSAHSWPCVW